MSKGQGNSYQKNKSMCINKTRALHSELFSEIRVEFRVGTSFSRVETSSEGSDITVPTRSDPNFCEFSRIFANFREFSRKLGSDITEIFPKFEKSPFPKLAKTKISEKNV